MTPPKTIFSLIVTLLLPTITTAQYFVSSQSGSTGIDSCSDDNWLNFQHIWDLCGETGCTGDWEQIGQLNLPCIPVGGGEDPQCATLDNEYYCRRVSGSYSGWGARNGMLNAYFDGPGGYCWTNDPDYFWIGGCGTYTWTALRSTIDGSWINIEFNDGVGGC